MRINRMCLTLSVLALLLLSAITLFGLACKGLPSFPSEPGGHPIIENQQNYEVRIYVTLISSDGTPTDPEKPIDYGVVPAQSIKEIGVIGFLKHSWVYRFEAVDSFGNVVFLHDYRIADLQKRGWKITIPP